jgi:hypothetical protein
METLQRTANRGSVSTGYDIDNSCKFEADNSEYLSRTPSSAGNRRTWTFSGWVKRTEIGSGGNTILSAGDTYIQFDGNALQINFRAASENFFIITNRLFRDTSAWYHIVVQCDTTQGTASNRAKVWVNGVQETSFSTSTYDNMSQNYDTLMNSTNEHEVGKYSNEETTYANFFNGYITELHLVDGTALTPTSFGEFDDDSGIWIPKAYTGSHGTNGFYLDFEDASNMGNDASGGTDFTETNITAADQATDTPTNNFATGNNRHVFSNPSTLVLTEGQTKIAKTANGWETLASTIAVTSGKWYMEMQNISVPESAMMSVFPTDIEFIGAGGQVNNYAGKVSGDGGISYYSYNGNVYQNAGNSSYGTAWANETNTMAIALDMDNGKVYFARANTWQNSGNPTSGATGTGAIDLIEPSKPHMMGYSIYANNTSGAVNFGGYTLSSISSAASDANGYGTFEYAPPSGYYALCTKNLAEYG